MTAKSLRAKQRRGMILPLIALCLVAILAFVAFAVDLAMIQVQRTQCQNAADCAALAGARGLNGTSGGSTTAATTNAQNAATANQVWGRALTASDLVTQHGAYHYDSTSQKFNAQFPPVAPDNYNVTQATVTRPRATAFSKVFGLSSSNVTATAIAAHRPRDVAIVLDFSGSMNNESDVWNCEAYLGNLIDTPNNTDPVFPQWGPYNPSFSSAANLQCTISDPLVGLCNITQSVLGVPALVNDFYANNRGSSAASAFGKAPNTVTSTAPAGDLYLPVKNTTTPAKCWQDITGSAGTKFTGYAAQQGGTFNGYTQGPGYWGKTFFLWPPDPNAANDWRKKFFQLSIGGPGVNDNTQLWDASGKWQDPPGNYAINYKAILSWIKNGPNPFPTQLRAGSILYYSQIPNDVPAASYDHTVLNSTISDPDQRFWKEYIDFTLGVWRDPFGNIQRPGNPACSFGPDFACGDGSGIQVTGPDSNVAGQVFIGPKDNPLRPRHRFWFGPITMIQYLMDTGMLPGTSHDISMVPAKLGISGALLDIQNNHPNDLVSIIFYARPDFAGEPNDAGEFASPISSLGNNYTQMINNLWYPPNGSAADVRTFDANGTQGPRAHGDYCGNTATSYGLMLAYNQFSGAQTLQGQAMGGFGRKGAQKMVILETDGMANVSTNANVTNVGAYKSYYNIGPSSSYSASGNDPTADAVDVGTNICALDTSGGTLPGYGTTRKPVQIHCIAFGAIFEPTASGSTASSAVSLLQQVSTMGGTVFPSSSSDPVNGYKWCIGTLAQRQSKLQQAFTTVMDSTITIVLVK